MFRAGYPDRALFLDSSLPFCDRKCLYLKVAVVLYRDNNRLTCEGSLLLVRAFADRINRFIDRPVFRFRQG
ncbi:MAG: hypothetical protein KDI17_13865 [Halioglobus sp.]|nr:hypothetical protein [Halioglobus sp.]